MFWGYFFGHPSKWKHLTCCLTHQLYIASVPLNYISFSPIFFTLLLFLFSKSITHSFKFQINVDTIRPFFFFNILAWQPSHISFTRCISVQHSKFYFVRLNHSVMRCHLHKWLFHLLYISIIHASFFLKLHSYSWIQITCIYCSVAMCVW